MYKLQVCTCIGVISAVDTCTIHNGFMCTYLSPPPPPPPLPPSPLDQQYRGEGYVGIRGEKIGHALVSLTCTKVRLSTHSIYISV